MQARSVFVLLSATLSISLACAGQKSASFVGDFYRTLSVTQLDRNFAFSPFSISEACSLAAAGARGGTKKELERAILPASMDLESKNSDEAQEIWNANRIWIQKGFKIEKSYIDRVKSKFGAEPGVLDFVHRPDEATRVINSWVEEQTHKKIKSLIPPNTLNESSRLVLTNAVYFKANWERAFIKSDTYDDDFVLSSGKKARVPFMHKTERLRSAETSDAEILELPYAGFREAMYIVLPKPGVPLEKIEKTFSVSEFQNWEKNLRSHEVHLGLPRFRFDSSFLLNENMKSIGIRRPFVLGQADFSGIDGAKDLYIAQVFHKAYLNVNEIGTEAAAATAIHMMYGAMMDSSKPIEFIANRPFLFVIEVTNTKTPLFIGRLENPRD